MPRIQKRTRPHGRAIKGSSPWSTNQSGRTLTIIPRTYAFGQNTKFNRKAELSKGDAQRKRDSAQPQEKEFQHAPLFRGIIRRADGGFDLSAYPRRSDQARHLRNLENAGAGTKSRPGRNGRRGSVPSDVGQRSSCVDSVGTDEVESDAAVGQKHKTGLRVLAGPERLE